MEVDLGVVYHVEEDVEHVELFGEDSVPLEKREVVVLLVQHAGDHLLRGVIFKFSLGEEDVGTDGVTLDLLLLGVVHQVEGDYLGLKQFVELDD